MKGAETRAEKLSGSFRRDFSMLDIALGAATSYCKLKSKPSDDVVRDVDSVMIAISEVERMRG